MIRRPFLAALLAAGLLVLGAGPAHAATLTISAPATVDSETAIRVVAQGDAPAGSRVGGVTYAGEGCDDRSPDADYYLTAADGSERVSGPFSVAKTIGPFGPGPAQICVRLLAPGPDGEETVVAFASQPLEVVPAPPVAPFLEVTPPGPDSPEITYRGSAPDGGGSVGAIVTDRSRCPAFRSSTIEDGIGSGVFQHLFGTTVDAGRFGGYGRARHMLPGSHRLCGYLLDQADQPVVTVSKRFRRDFGPWLGTGPARRPRAGRWKGAAREALNMYGGFERFRSRAILPSFRVRRGRMIDARLPVQVMCDVEGAGRLTAIRLSLRIRHGRVALFLPEGEAWSVEGRFVTPTKFRGRVGIRYERGYDQFTGGPGYCSGVMNFVATRRGP